MGGKSSTTTQKVMIPPEVLARYNAVNKQAETVAGTPFQQYSTDPSAFVAQLTPQQLTGISNVNQAAGSYQPYFAGATGATVAGMGGVNPGELDVGRYMNPFQQSVIDTTMARMQKEQQAAQSGALGTAISSGAFGGDRAGIAAANLAYEQDLSRASTLAGLNAQNFEQAMATAQQQQGLGLSAEQANLARLMAGGQQLAGLGQAAQQAGLQGAEAQINAGTLEQQTEQAGKTALYNQFMQEKAYPFQVAQFLANIAMGTGALSGSTTSTTQPTPFWSDRRLKHDIKRIGKTDDGLPIYTFKYKGDPEEQTHVGFMADEVEQHKPEAVGLAPNGYKYVDYDRATKAGGGGVAGPYGASVGSQPGAEGYVPQAFLPVGDLMVADSQIPQVTNQTLAAQMEAAASFGESLKRLKSDYGDLRDWWNKKDAPEQGAVTPGVPNVPGSWRGGIVGYASGGSAEYLQPGLAGAQQPTEPKSYVADTVESQEEAKKNGLMAPGSAPGAPQSTVGKIGEAAGTALTVAKLFALSDRRAKHSIRRIGKTDNGMPIYSFKYRGDDRERTHIGFMADEVEREHPDAVSTGPEGLKRVDYSQSHKFYQGGAVRPAYADGGYPVGREGENRRLGLVSGVSADPSGGLVPDAPAAGRPGGYQAAATDRGVQSQLAAELAAILNRPKETPPGLASGIDYHAMPDAAKPGFASDLSDVSDPFILRQRADDLEQRAAINQVYGPKYAGLARAQLEEAGALRDRVGADWKPYFSGDAAAPEAPAAGLGYAGLPTANINAPAGPVGLGVPAIDRAREEFPVGASPAVVDGLGAAKSPSGVAPPVIAPQAATQSPTGVAPVAGVDKDAAWNYMVNRESGNRQFDENGSPLQSPKGAIGAAQILPSTGPEAAKLAGLEWNEQRFYNDPEYNKALGKAYYDEMYRRFGAVDKAMAAYNAGPGALSSAIDRATALGGSYLDYLPKETQDYVRGFTGAPAPEAATGLAPSSRKPFFGLGNEKPYEERNAVGRMFYNPDGTVNQDAILSLLAGVGTMASSPSLYLGSSILQGLGGFANAYTGLQKQRADIGLTKAQTAGTQVQTDVSRFFTIGPNGMPMVVLGPGKAVSLSEYRANPQLFSTGDRDMDARIMAEASRREAASGVPYGAPNTAKPEGILWSPKSEEAIQRASEMALARPDLYQTWQAQIADAIPQYSQARSEAISGKPNVNELAAMVGGAIFDNNMGTVEGYLSGTAVPAINAALRTVGAPEISSADSQRQVLDKLSALNGAALTPEQERAASVFQMFANVSPNMTMTPEAAATISASIMLQNQQAIDQANYYNGFLSALPMGAPMSEVDAAYAQEYSQLHQQEKANLTQLLEMAGDTSPIGDGSTTRGEYVNRFLTAANSGTVSQEDAQKVLSYLLGENASPLLARYFVKGM